MKKIIVEGSYPDSDNFFKNKFLSGNQSGRVRGRVEVSNIMSQYIEQLNDWRILPDLLRVKIFFDRTNKTGSSK